MPQRAVVVIVLRRGDFRAQRERIEALIDRRVAQLRVLAAQSAVQYWRERRGIGNVLPRQGRPASCAMRLEGAQVTLLHCFA